MSILRYQFKIISNSITPVSYIDMQTGGKVESADDLLNYTAYPSAAREFITASIEHRLKGTVLILIKIKVK